MPRHLIVKLAVLSVLFAALTMGATGCSPSINAWADRGLAGLALERNNAAAWHDWAQEQIDRQQQGAIDAVYADLRAAMAGNFLDKQEIIDPGTGKAVEIDEAWLAASRAVLGAQLDGYRTKRDALRQRFRTQDANIARVEEAFIQIRRLNKVYVSNADVVATVTEQIARLASELAAMRALQESERGP